MSNTHLLHLWGRKRVPIRRQAEASECGLVCLSMIAEYYGLDVDIVILRRRFPIGLRGASLKGLMEAAKDLSLNARALRVEISELASIQMPVILHWDLIHYVVLSRIENRFGSTKYFINDPSHGETILTTKELSAHFTGVALELTKAQGFQAAKTRSSLRISQLWSSTTGGIGVFCAVLSLSLIMQLIALVSPFFLQLGIDTVLPSADVDLLRVLAFGFGGLVLINAFTAWLRQLSLLNLSNSFSFQVTSNLANHLLKLPLSWSEKRHVGDIISRFGSIQPISDFVSQGIISSLIDGAMSLLTLIIIFIYSPLLGSIAVSTCVLYLLFKWLSLSAMKRANVSAITAGAKENSAFIETVRGLPTIKAFSKEGMRHHRWQTLKAVYINAQLKLGRITAGFDSGLGAILAGEKVLFTYIAVKLVINGTLTVGMIFALLAYKEQFISAATRVMDQMVRYRLIDVHLARIADIAFSAPEAQGVRHASDSVIDIKGEIEFRNVSFCYGMSDNLVLRNVSFCIKSGETAVFIGSSGGGKTTILKLIMGLLEPTAGTILVDGRPLESIGAPAWRCCIGSIMQDDRLFSGSLAENIAFFEPEFDLDRVRTVCENASVLTEIESMPLGFDTLVGDMGSSLSGGQRQRVILARALYANPSVLIMDEGTANLDPKSESAIVENLKEIPITKIVSTHRPALLNIASRIMHVSDGAVIEVLKKPVSQGVPMAADAR